MTPKLATLSLLFLLPLLSSSRDTLTPSHPLALDETLISAAQTFALGFFTPPSSPHKYLAIWYNNITTKTIVWVANRANPLTTSNATLTISNLGVLNLVDANSTIQYSFSSSSHGLTSPVARLLDTGNFVVTDNKSSDYLFWQSFDYPTDTLLPGMKLGYDLRRGLNRNLTAWKSDSDPSPGDVCVAMDIHGDPQLTVFFGYVKKWWSGPWTGYEFNGIPEMSTYTSSGFSFGFVNNENEVYYSYDMANRSIYTRLMANGTGKVQRWVWLGQSWGLFWSMPNNACEYSKCGEYSMCDPNASPICACLQGFEPRFTVKWNYGDWSGGCVRKHGLDCVNGSDGFVRVNKAMLPDTSNVTVDMSAGLDQCRAKCLMNCSCRGYAGADVRGDGSGCILWIDEIVDLRLFRLFEVGGQDFFYRVSDKDIITSGTFF